jgi:hypothetical protein
MTVAYVTYTYYQNTYLGTVVPSAVFSQFALRASARLDQLTYNRAVPIVTAATETDIIDLIKMAACALADELYSQYAIGGQDAIQSQTVGASSVTYALGATALKTSERKLSDAAKVYLGSTGLMYRGFNSDEIGSIYVD